MFRASPRRRWSQARHRLLARRDQRRAGPGDGNVIYYVVGALLLGAALSVAGALARDPWWRRVLFGFAGAVVLVLAWLGGLSFGPLLIPAILLLVLAFSRG